MKRVLFVESYPQGMFGQQRTLLSLLSACPSAGIEPVVAATAEGPFTEEVRRRSIPLVLFPYPEALSVYGGAIYRYRGLHFWRMIRQWTSYLGSLHGEMKVLKLDGVYCNDMRGLLTAGIAARCLGLPVMIWDKLDKPHGWMDWLQLPLVRKNIIISKAVLRKYPAWQVRLLRNRIELVHEGADLERFQGTKSVRRTLGLGEGDLVLALIGSVTERKGHDRIFSLWPDLSAAFPSLRLWVVGGTEADGKYMENLPNKNHPGVRFLGFREDIPDLLESIDILLIPSRNEGLPLVVMEAMAASRPVIGSDAGGIPEVVLDGVTGLVVRGDDGEGWKAAIGRLASSPELRAQMGLAGRKRVEAEFNRPAQMKKVLEHLLDMTHGR